MKDACLDLEELFKFRLVLLRMEQFDHASLHRIECPGDKHMQLREGQKFLGR